MRIAAYAAFVAAVIPMSLTAPARADEPPKVQRSILLKEDLSLAGQEGVMAKVELAPGATEGKHTHPAEAFAFVLEGEIVQEIDGKPTQTLKAGDIFHVPPNTVHCATNKGAVPAKLAVVFVAEKGKPLTTPVK